MVRETRATIKNRRKTTGPLLLLALPGLIYLLINNYIPMLGIFIAFKDIDFSKGILKSPWCGFKNFEFLFRTPDAAIMIRNTLLYNLSFIIVGTICAIFLAILVHEVVEYSFSKVIQTGLILPNLISMVVVSYLVFAFLNSDNGFINNTVLKSFNADPISWYSEKKYWPFILLIVQTWKTAGYSSIVYIAVIAGIDKGLYEAARIDGAGKIRQIFHITIPHLKPTIVIMVLLAIGRIFSSDFGLFFQVPMDTGALYDVTQTIDTYVYRALMRMGNIGMSSAAGLLQSVVGFILFIAANQIVRRTNSENALF